MIQAILIVLVAGLLGRGFLRALYRRPLDNGLFGADYFVVGGMVLIGGAEAAHMAAIVLGRTFTDCVKVFAVILLLLLFLSALLIVWGRRLERHDKLFLKERNRRKIKKAITAEEKQRQMTVITLVFGVMVLVQLVLLGIGQNIYPTGDMTVETVNSMLETNQMYSVNPMTGQPYTAGIPMRLKILCLPTLYAILCDMSGLDAMQLVWQIVPMVVLLGSYAAFGSVAGALFPEENKKKGIFMIVVALLLWSNVAMYGMDGFGLQYAGYRGVSIRMGVLLPYTFGLVLRQKWRLLPLCILAEACIVWTLYGMGFCFFVTVAILGAKIVKWGLLQIKNSKKQVGKEGDL
uniref:DUF6077 domain-containing protein n=1 Tax=Acetatifactor sp. TaxID=1872090 RepID=UPI004055A0DD